MPLPTMAGSDDTLMTAPGLQGMSPDQDSGNQDVNVQEQAKGAVQIVSQLRQQTQSQLEAIATQFPTVSKAAKDLQQAFDRGLQALVKELIKTVNIPEGQTPRIVR